MEITPEEKLQYFEFVAGLLKQVAAEPAPDILWHYTTGETLIKIIETCTLWATQISCLNDHREFRLASAELAKAMDNYAYAKKLSPDEEFLYQKASKELAVDSAPTNWWFVTCFSGHKDDLSQWRAYSGGEGGYAIGFKGYELAMIGAADQSYLAPVRYEAAVHSEIARKVADATFRFFTEGLKARNPGDRDAWADAFFIGWSDAITFLAPIVKHHSFESEKEWRLVRRLRADDVPKMKYRQRQMMMSRHLPLHLGVSPVVGNPSLLPIAEIIVGPSRHKEISKVSVGDLLKTNGYNLTTLKVTLSDVPFQTL